VCQAKQRSSAPTVVCNATVKRYSARLRAQSQSRRQKAHRTVNRTCPVHHRTIRWPSCQNLQRSEPNGLVTWLAHRTVSGGAPDCPVRHTTEALTNGSFGGWGYKYPPTTKPHTRARDFIQRHNQRDQILSQVRNHSNQISD
jgi:hypothetical protein